MLVSILVSITCHVDEALRLGKENLWIWINYYLKSGVIDK